MDPEAEGAEVTEDEAVVGEVAVSSTRRLLREVRVLPEVVEIWSSRREDEQEDPLMVQ